ncbi:MAG TPA: hypothetical protein VIY29_18730, partial [Ktedonobacteraceae bacterium]
QETSDVEAARFYDRQLHLAYRRASNEGMKVAFTVWALMGLAVASGVTGGLAGEAALGALAGEGAQATLGAKLLAAGFGGFVGGSVDVGGEQALRLTIGERLLSEGEVVTRVGLSTGGTVAGEALSMGASWLYSRLRSSVTAIEGAAQGPALTYAKNAPTIGARTPEEALKLAEQHGVKIPEEARFFFTEIGIPARADAAYLSMEANPSELISFESMPGVRHSLVNAETGQIPVRLKPGLLLSDEALIAHIGHESYELNALRSKFEKAGGAMKLSELHSLIGPDMEGNLHAKAWNFANKLTFKMRGLPPY